MTPLQWFFILFIILFLLVIALFTYSYFTNLYNDYFIVVNRNNTLGLYKTSYKNKEYIEKNESIYPIDYDFIGKTDKGKRIYIVPEDDYRHALKIEHQLDTWLSSKTAMKVLNDKHIQEIVDPSTSGKELIMLIGAICSIIGLACSVFILLVIMKVIKVGIAVTTAAS